MNKEELRKYIIDKITERVFIFHRDNPMLQQWRKEDEIVDFILNELESKNKEIEGLRDAIKTRNIIQAEDKAEREALEEQIEELREKLRAAEISIELADQMEKAMRKLLTGLATDGTAIEGFTDAWNTNLKYLESRIQGMLSGLTSPGTEVTKH